MKRSAEFVADELRQVGIDAKVVQSRNPDGTPGAWEVIGSKIVDPQGPHRAAVRAPRRAACAGSVRMGH